MTLIAIDITLIPRTFVKANPPTHLLLAILIRIGLAFIDVYYTFRHAISSIYLADALPEFAFFRWLYRLIHYKELI